MNLRLRDIFFGAVMLSGAQWFLYGGGAHRSLAVANDLKITEFKQKDVEFCLSYESKLPNLDCKRIMDNYDPNYYGPFGP